MNKIIKNFRLITLLMVMVFTSSAIAQDRKPLRDAIQQWESCRNVALSENRGSVAIYGQDGYASVGVPSTMDAALKKLHTSHQYIKDVHVTEEGKWLILYDGNGYQYFDIPSYMAQRLKEFHGYGESILGASFNDNGEWIVISDNHYAASNEELQEWVKSGIEKYGKPWSCCITNDAYVVVYEDGYLCKGNIPLGLEKTISDSGLTVYTLKVCGNAWFFADDNGRFKCSL